jgi:hypothetical protein
MSDIVEYLLRCPVCSCTVPGPDASRVARHTLENSADWECMGSGAGSVAIASRPRGEAT